MPVVDERTRSGIDWEFVIKIGYSCKPGADKRVIQTDDLLNDMKLLELVTGFALVALLLITSKKGDTASPTGCELPTTLTAQAPCESGYADVVVLKASGYIADPAALTELKYAVYPQKDTTSSDLTGSGYRESSGDYTTIPLAELNSAARFIVVISKACPSSATGVVTTNFAFVKRQTPNTACYVWGPQRM